MKLLAAYEAVIFTGTAADNNLALQKCTMSFNWHYRVHCSSNGKKFLWLSPHSFRAKCVEDVL